MLEGRLTLLFLTLTISVFSCKQDIEPEDLMTGVWTSEDEIYTMDFRDQGSFWLSRNGSNPDLYAYNLKPDSIVIQYSGRKFIYVFAKTHFFEIHPDVMTIDLSNGCYGFADKRLTFRKHD